jgi:hypothetical protein
MISAMPSHINFNIKEDSSDAEEGGISFTNVSWKIAS